MPVKLDPRMSDYEARKWRELIDAANRLEGLGLAPVRVVRRAIDAVSTKASAFVDEHEVVKKVVDLALVPIEGLNAILTDAARATVRDQGVVRKAKKKDPSVDGLADFRRLDLSVLDGIVGNPRLRYALTLGVEGAGTSLLITGATVSATVSGGTTVAIAAGALGADVVANLGAAARAVAVIATSYGYDLRDPEEQLYASGVLSYGTAGSAATKTASLAQLSRLTQAMMRGATHQQLDKFIVVQVTKQVFKLLGFRATHQKLAQFVPLVGAVYNAGLNAAAIQLLIQRAQHAYRLRFLTEKYDLDASTWLTTEEGPVPDSEIVIDLEQIIKDVQEEQKQGPDDQKDEKQG